MDPGHDTKERRYECLVDTKEEKKKREENRHNLQYIKFSKGLNTKLENFLKQSMYIEALNSSRKDRKKLSQVNKLILTANYVV